MLFLHHKGSKMKQEESDRYWLAFVAWLLRQRQVLPNDRERHWQEEMRRG